MAHYKQGAVECITAMESAFGPMDVAVFCRLNAFKYIWRMKVHEDGPESNTKKAVYFLEKAMYFLEKDIDYSRKRIRSTPIGST